MVETTINVLPRQKVEAVLESNTFYVHHTLVGAGIIAGAVVIGAVVPSVKPTTRIAIAGLGALLGAILIWDDVSQHMESGCSLDTILNFVPCPEKPAVTVVKKPEV